MCCPAQLEAEGPNAGGMKPHLVRPHLGTAKFETSSEFGGFPPSFPLFPWREAVNLEPAQAEIWDPIFPV